MPSKQHTSQQLEKQAQRLVTQGGTNTIHPRYKRVFRRRQSTATVQSPLRPPAPPSPGKLRRRHHALLRLQAYPWYAPSLVSPPATHPISIRQPTTNAAQSCPLTVVYHKGSAGVDPERCVQHNIRGHSVPNHPHPPLSFATKMFTPTGRPNAPSLYHPGAGSKLPLAPWEAATPPLHKNWRQLLTQGTILPRGVQALSLLCRWNWSAHFCA